MIRIDEVNRNNYAAQRANVGEMAKKRASEDVRGNMVGIRLTDEDAERLDALVAKVPIATKHAIAREALRIGMTALEKDMGRLVNNEPRPRKRRGRAK
jgi:hypothetical protein